MAKFWPHDPVGKKVSLPVQLDFITLMAEQARGLPAMGHAVGIIAWRLR